MTKVGILPRQLCRDGQDAGAAKYNYNYNLVTVFLYLLALRIRLFWVHTYSSTSDF